jgi:transcription-repair coupling factor (superfamily II helicase)
MIKLKNKIFNSPSFINFPLEKVSKDDIQITGLSGSIRAFLVTYLHEKLKNPIVFISSNSESAEKLFEDIQQILPEQHSRFIPKIENHPYD